MKKILLFSMIGLAGILSAFVPNQVSVPARGVPVETTKWVADKAHTSIKFTVTHLLISDVDGTFKSFDGSMESSKADFSDAKIIFTADVNSVNTDNEKRDADLKSDNFFNAAKFPQIKFESSSFTPLGNNKYTLIGNLTIRDVTKVVTFDVTYGGTATMYGVHAGFKAKAKIDRFDYNLKWNAMTEAGGAVVGKEVEITINVDFKKS
jgi:polyisoprenoid-binding protein YceI